MFGRTVSSDGGTRAEEEYAWLHLGALGLGEEQRAEGDNFSEGHMYTALHSYSPYQQVFTNSYSFRFTCLPLDSEIAGSNKGSLILAKNSVSVSPPSGMLY